MKILILSTSPRKSFSTSMYFSKILRLFLMGHQVEVISLKSVRDYEQAVARLEKIDTLVFATPVYVDTIPSTTLAYLKQMEAHLVANSYDFNVYALTNCGFYEGHQCKLALKTYEIWCERAGVNFLGGIGIGSGVMLGFVRLLPLIGLGTIAIELFVRSMVLVSNGTFSLQAVGEGYLPMSFIIQTVLWFLFTLGAFIHIFQLRTAIVQQRRQVERYTTVWFCTRYLFVGMASLYWIFRALLVHGVMPWRLFKKVEEDFTDLS